MLCVCLCSWSVERLVPGSHRIHAHVFDTVYSLFQLLKLNDIKTLDHTVHCVVLGVSSFLNICRPVIFLFEPSYIKLDIAIQMSLLRVFVARPRVSKISLLKTLFITQQTIFTHACLCIRRLVHMRASLIPILVAQGQNCELCSMRSTESLCIGCNFHKAK